MALNLAKCLHIRAVSAPFRLLLTLLTNHSPSLSIDYDILALSRAVVIFLPPSVHSLIPKTFFDGPQDLLLRPFHIHEANYTHVDKRLDISQLVLDSCNYSKSCIEQLPYVLSVLYYAPFS